MQQSRRGCQQNCGCTRTSISPSPTSNATFNFRILLQLSWTIRIQLNYEHLNNPANEVRLLRLHLGGPNGRLQATLSHVNLETTRFQALSYVWGQGLLNRGFVGVSYKKSSGLEHYVVSRGENLKLASQYIRDNHEDIVLWIDNVFINQSENVESPLKSH
jgi:hypothetical protein